MKTIIALVQGDAAGVGAELLAKLLDDQGQIAIKLLGFHMGVTVLGGLPFPVATPAHGTAFDIAGTNSARVEPARRAFMMACDMAENRKKVAA